MRLGEFGAAALCILFGAARCGGNAPAAGKSHDAGADTGADAKSDAALDAPAEATTDAGCSSPYAVGPAKSAAEWCDVDKVLTQSLASSGVGTSQYPGFAFQVYEFDATKGEPVLRYSRAAGTIQGTTADVALPIATASGAKIVAALLIARSAAFAADEGETTLSPNTSIQVLGCTGLPAGLDGTTLSDLMHQTAGLTPNQENACIRSLTPLENCACTILQNEYVPAYDGTFAYTPHNFTVAVAMADQVLKNLPTPTDVRTLFNTFIGEVGIPSAEASLPLGNNFAGGDHLSAHAFGTLLALALPGPARGTYHGKTLLAADILDQMNAPFGDNVPLTQSPYFNAVGLKMRYGFGDWVQCGDPWPEPAAWPALDAPIVTLDYATCPYRVVSSLGKFGYMPWYSARAKRPYAAALAVNLSGAAPLVSVNSFAAYEMLDPLLRAAIDATPR